MILPQTYGRFNQFQQHAGGLPIWTWVASFTSCTGNLFPSSGTNDASYGDGAWADPGNITADDAAYATKTLQIGGNEQSNYLKALTWSGHGIPAVQDVTEITVRVQRHMTAGGNLADDVVRLVINGSVTGTDKSAGAAFPTSPGTVSFTDDPTGWGVTASFDDWGVFGVVYACETTAGMFDQFAFVDFITLEVCYTPAAVIAGLLTLPLLGVGK